MYKLLSINVLAFFLLITFTNCQRDDDPDTRTYPRITTLAVSDNNSSGVSFKGELTSMGTSGVTDCGFMWDTDSDPKTVMKSLGAQPRTGVISTTINSGLKAGTTYYVRAYAKNNVYTVYGNVVSFTSQGSLAPRITGMHPQQGVPGDTIILTGQHFGYDSRLLYTQFGFNHTYLAGTTDSTIRAIVPLTLTQSPVNVSVTINSQLASAPGQFTLLLPTLSDFTPKQGPAGTLVTITGANFSPVPYANVVSFGGYSAQVVSASHNQLQVQVPAQLTGGPVDVMVSLSGQTLTFQSQFQPSAAH